MQDLGIVLEVMEQDVLVVESGSLMKSLMAVTLYRQPYLRLVLTRETSMPNAIGATVSYTEIKGDTLEDLKKSWDEQNLMILKPLPPQKNGRKKSYWN